MTKPLIPEDQNRIIADLQRRLTAVEALATARTARGIVAKQIRTTNAGPYTASATTDFALGDVPVESTRLYAVHLQTTKSMSAVGNWGFYFHVEGVQTIKLGHWNEVDATFPLINNEHYCKLWEPDSGTFDLDVRVVEETGSGDLTLSATSVITREFWVEDVGPRI